jgi:hypothetical protein
MRYWWLAWWQARRYWLLASMTCRRYSSAGISNGTPRTRLGGPGMWAGHRGASYTVVSTATCRRAHTSTLFDGSPVVIAPLWPGFRSS